jgi:glutaminyl-peptide cyclotransferase
MYKLFLFAILLVSCGGSQDKSQEKSQEQQTMQQAKTITPEYVKNYKVNVVSIFPHDSLAYTQGLFYLNGFLYESSGLYGYSTLRKVDLKTGKVLKKIDINQNYFAEGCAVVDNKIYQLTWLNNKCFVYDINTFQKINEFTYSGEGWGLTTLDGKLVLSDGSPNIRFYEPSNFSRIKAIIVTSYGVPVKRINELEIIDNEIWANIWQCDSIVRIDKETGKVNAWIDISSLRHYLALRDFPDVLNGIAYDAEHKKIYLTGKLWSQMFEITLEEK